MMCSFTGFSIIIKNILGRIFVAESISKTTAVMKSSSHVLALALAMAFAIPLFNWFTLFPLAGYSTGTIRIALGLTLIGAAVFITAARIGWRRLGLAPAQLMQAIVLIGLAYGLILLVGWGMNAGLGANLRLFRDTYSLPGLFDNWLLAGLGEELMFCGVIFTLMANQLPSRRRWLAVVLVALLFALWHLPGYIAQTQPVGRIIGRMALNAVSWGIFGTVYMLSGNLWLAALTHASTDYGLSPMVTGTPLMGLIFMAFVIFAAWFLRRRVVGPRRGKRRRSTLKQH
jgi:membrane protease YdiL (CAAX protease family)